MAGATRVREATLAPAGRPTAARRARLTRIILAAALTAFALSLPWIFATNYWRNLMTLALIQAIAVLGLNFVLGMTGQMSLAQAAFWGIGAYTSSLMATRWGTNFWVGLVAGALVAALFGAVLGFPALKLSGHYLAMTTIGFGIIVGLVLLNWTWLTGGADGVRSIPNPAIGAFRVNNWFYRYYLALAFLVVLALIQSRILRSRAGRAFLAIRENELAAEATGVDTTRYKVIAFMLAAAYAGVSGVIYAHSYQYISPDTFNFDHSVLFLTMLVLGGAGSVAGPILGATLLTFVPEWIRLVEFPGIDTFIRTGGYLALYGIGVMLTMVFLPAGLWGLVERAFRRLTNLGRQRGDDPYENAEPPDEVGGNFDRTEPLGGRQ